MHNAHSFRKELTKLINRESMENGSNTPDFLLAEFLYDILAAFNRAVTAREKWCGREPERVPDHLCPQPAPPPGQSRQIEQDFQTIQGLQKQISSLQEERQTLVERVKYLEGHIQSGTQSQ